MFVYIFILKVLCYTQKIRRINMELQIVNILHNTWKHRGCVLPAIFLFVIVLARCQF